MELEFKRDDGSWHPCGASLSSGDSPLGIIIKFENCDEEEIISNTEDFLAKLRFRSLFLQAGECSKIKQNESVLAMHDINNNNDPSENLFFDAVIEKINKVRHSDRLFCRCTFEIKFLSPHIKNQTIKVPSNYIMRLSNEQIETHTVYKAFLESTSPRAKLEFHEFDNSSSDNESDLNCLLEKQVEEISKLAEGVDYSNDFMNGTKKANEKRIKKRNNQIKQKIRPEIKLKNEKPSFLSPLAARAAVAFLRVGSPVIEIPDSETETENTFPDSVAQKQTEKSCGIPKELEIPDLPRRTTRSSARRSLDSTINQNEENEKIENKKIKCVSPSTDTSIGNITSTKSKSRTFKKMTQPTRSSSRLSSL